MNLQELFQTIESSWFAANINILSGYQIFLRALQNDETLKQLVDILRDSPHNRNRVFQRLIELLVDNPEPQYAHPHDAALAGYLYALNQVDKALAEQAFEQIERTPNLWWARRLVKHIRDTAETNVVQAPNIRD